MQTKKSDGNQGSDKSENILNDKTFYFHEDYCSDGESEEEDKLISYLDDPKERRVSNSLPNNLRRKWIRVAFWLSVLAAFVTIAFSLASFFLCKETASSSILANALDAFLGTISSLAVAWRFRDELNGGKVTAQRERIATFGIGLSFLLTGIISVAASIVHLTEIIHPSKTDEMLIILWCSLVVFLFLAYVQRCLAEKLNSQSMWAASADSAMAAAMSCGIAMSTLLYRYFPKELWWLDHGVALALGIISVGYGIHLVTLVALCNREIFCREKLDDNRTSDKIPR